MCRWHHWSNASTQAAFVRLHVSAPQSSTSRTYTEISTNEKLRVSGDACTPDISGHCVHTIPCNSNTPNAQRDYAITNPSVGLSLSEAGIESKATNMRFSASVTETGTNGQRVFDFLLLSNSNMRPHLPPFSRFCENYDKTVTAVVMKLSSLTRNSFGIMPLCSPGGSSLQWGAGQGLLYLASLVRNLVTVPIWHIRYMRSSAVLRYLL